MPFKVFIINGNRQYEEMFLDMGWELSDNPHDADAFQFCGGEDVSPELYGAEVHPTTHRNWRRDLQECKLYAFGLSRQKPMMGICRGGQFLFVMNGGRMVQDVNNHTRPHEVHHTLEGRISSPLTVTSTHHQMMDYRGMPLDGTVLAYARHLATDFEGRKRSGNYDLEAVFFRRTKSLCFQPHPEFEKGECRGLYQAMVEEYIEPLIYQG